MHGLQSIERIHLKGLGSKANNQHLKDSRASNNDTEQWVGEHTTENIGLVVEFPAVEEVEELEEDEGVENKCEVPGGQPQLLVGYQIVWSG